MFESKTINGKRVYSIDKATCEKMLKIARNALHNSFTANKKYAYAVAALTKKGNIYPGVSYCSDTFTLTMHSEATALAHAAIHGEKEIIAITGPNCHICKQLIYENSLRSKIDIVIVIREKGKIRQVPISSLMPFAWPKKPNPQI